MYLRTSTYMFYIHALRLSAAKIEKFKFLELVSLSLGLVGDRLNKSFKG